MIVAIHGANSAAAELEPLTAELRRYGEVFAPNLAGHGGRPLPPELEMDGLARDLLAQMDERGIARAPLVGYSLGGLLALYIARHHPARVAAVCGLATKVVFDEATVKHWTYLASLERLEQPGQPRGAQLEKTHLPQDWRAVARANQRFFTRLGSQPALTPEDLAALAVPVMLVSGDRDQLVPWSEVLATGRQIPGCKLVMFYGVAHPIAAVPVTSVARVIGEWVAKA